MKERKNMRLVNAWLDRAGETLPSLGRRKITRRIVSGVLAFSMIATTALTNVGITAWAAGDGDIYTHGADGDTSGTYNYQGRMDLSSDSANSGRVWTDKSVKDNGNMTFTETFSALGSGLQVSGQVPCDLVIVFDNSGSMYTNAKIESQTRIAQTINAINTTVANLMRKNPNNRVAIVSFAGNDKHTATTVVPMQHYDSWQNLSVHYNKAADGSITGGHVTSAYYKNGADITNGYTNIQAGIAQGMNELLEASKTKSVLINGETVNRIPALIVLTDGQATDGLKNVTFDGDGKVTSMTNLGFLNDFNNDTVSFTGKRDNGNYTWQAFIEKFTGTDTTTITKVKKNGEIKNIWKGRYPYALVSTAQNGKNTDGKADDSLKTLASDYMQSQQYMLLSTLITAGYMKQKVSEKYSSPCKVYTVTVDLDPEGSTITSSGPTMNPSTYFGGNGGKNTWLKTYKGKYKTNQVGGRIYSAVENAEAKLNEWRDNPNASYVYRPIASGESMWDKISKELDITNKLNDKATAEQTFLTQAILRYTGKAGDNQGIRTEFFVVDERAGNTAYKLPDVPESYRKGLNINYADVAYDNTTSAEGSIQNAFTEILNKTYVSETSSPISGGYVGQLTYTDPIGRYMEIKAGSTMTLTLPYQGNTITKTLTVNQDGSVNMPNEVVTNPGYGKQFNLNQISIHIEETGSGAEKRQTLEVKMPAVALPVRVAKYNANSSPRYSADQSANPFTLTYTVGICDAIKSGSDIDVSKVSEEYIEGHTTNNGEVMFYTNGWEGSERANAGFTPNGTNSYYKGGSHYSNSEDGSTQHAPMVDQTTTKQSDVTGQFTGRYQAYEPTPQNGEVTEYLDNNGYVGVKTGKLLINKTVTAGEGITVPDTDFSFTVRFTTQSGTPLSGSVVAETYVKSGDDWTKSGDASKTITLKDDGTHTFTLKADHGLYFPRLQAGTKYQVTETNLPLGFSQNSPQGSCTDAIVANTESKAEFVNKYEVGSLEISKVIDKNESVEGPEDQTSAFTFTVEFGNGYTLSSPPAEVTGSNGTYTFTLNGGKNVSFENLPVGLTYTVKETNGAVGYKYGSVKVNGTPADSSEGTVTGKIETAGQKVTVEYTNKKLPREGKFQLSATKTVVTEEDYTIKAGNFDFEIIPDEKNNEFDPIKRAGGFANGKLIVHNEAGTDLTANVPLFDVKYTHASTYTYTVKEIPGNENGMLYDSSEYTITVIVKDKSSGDYQPEYDVTFTITKQDSEGNRSEVDSIDFTNRYTTSALVELSGTKTVVAGLGSEEVPPELEEGKFTFELLEAHKVETADETLTGEGQQDNETAAAGDEQQSEETTPAGDEQQSEEADPTGDEQQSEETAEAGDEQQSEETATAGGEAQSEEAAPAGDEAQSEETAPEKGTQQNDVTDSIGDEQQDEADSQPTMEDSGIRAAQNENSAALEEVSEATPSDANKPSTMPMQQTVIVGKVTKDEAGNKTATPFYFNEQDIQKVDVSAQWETGEVILNAKNEADGTFTFDPIELTEAGTYYYIIREKNDDADSYIYDESQYLVTVVVVREGGETGAIKLESVTYRKMVISEDTDADNDEVKIENKAAFTNIYKKDTPIIEIHKDQSVKEGFYGEESERTRDKIIVKEGDIITYYLTVKNLSSTEATKVTVTDKIPESTDGTALEYIEGTATVPDEGDSVSYDDATGVLTWIISLRRGEEKELSFQVRVPDVSVKTEWTNIACANGNTWTERVRSESKPPLIEIEKWQSKNNGVLTKKPMDVDDGDVVTYYLLIKSGYPNPDEYETAKNVVVADTVPAGSPELTYVPGSAIQIIKDENSAGLNLGTYDESTKTITWNLGDMEPGTYKWVSFQVTVPDVETHTEWTNIGHTHYDNNPDNPEDQDQPLTEIPSNEVKIQEDLAALVIEKEQSLSGEDGSFTTDTLTAEDGDIVTYRITVKHADNSKAKAHDVVITDTLPTGNPNLMLLVPSISDGGKLSEDKSQIIWELGTLKLGEKKTVTFQMLVPDVNVETTWGNVAAVSHKDHKDPEFSVEVKVTEKTPHITIEKTQDRNDENQPTTNRLEVDDPDIVTYWLKITSDGEETAKNVVVTDTVPESANSVKLEYVEASAGPNETRPSYDPTTRTITWHLGNMQPKEVKKVYFKVSVPNVDEDTEWTNQGFVNFDNRVPDPENPGEDLQQPIPSNEVEIHEGVPVLRIMKQQAVARYKTTINEETNETVTTDEKETVITKTNERSTVVAEDEITYYLTVSHDATSTADAKNVVISDKLPEEPKGLTLIEDSISLGGVYDNGVITWHFESLPKNEEREVSFTMKVGDVAEHTVWTNVGHLNYKDNKTETTTEKIVVEEFAPDVHIEKFQSKNDGEKTKNPLEVDDPDEVTYYLRVTNDGTEKAINLKVSDEVPDGLTLVEGSISDGGTLGEDGKTITWKIAELEVGGSFEVSFKVTVPDVKVETTWKNIGKLTYENNPDGPDEEIPSNVVEIIEGIPLIQIVKAQALNGGKQTTDRLTAVDGDEVTYYLTVSHKEGSKGTAKDVVVTDEIPSEPLLTLKEGSISEGGVLQSDGKTIRWNLGNLPNGESRVVSFTVIMPDVDKETIWKNVGMVSQGDPDDPETPPPTPSNEVEVGEKIPNVIIQKAQSSNRYDRTTETFRVYGGDEVTYYLTVTSNGKEAARGVVVKDTIPQQTTQGDKIPLILVEGSISDGGTLEEDGITIVWNLGNMNAGEVRELSFKVKVPATSGTKNWKNISQVSYDNPPKDPEHPDGPAPGSHENPTPSNEVEIYRRPNTPGNPGNPGNPGPDPGDNPPTPELTTITNEPTPLGSLTNIEDEDVPLAFLAPTTGDEKPVGAAALFGLLALGMMGAFGIMAFKKDEEDA